MIRTHAQLEQKEKFHISAIEERKKIVTTTDFLLCIKKIVYIHDL